MQQLEVPEKLRESQVRNETADVGGVENQWPLPSTQLLCLKPNTRAPHLPYHTFLSTASTQSPLIPADQKTAGDSVHQKHFILLRLHLCEKSCSISKFES